MANSVLSETILSNASRIGETKAADALSKLAKKEVTVKTTQAKLVAEEEALDTLNNIEGHAIIAYAEILTGAAGSSLLTMERQSALDFVDLFNNRPKGTTLSMQELDRSTIKETLNILSNAYITEVANEMGDTILLSVPRMLTKGGLEDLVRGMQVTSNRMAALFQTELKVENTDYKVELYFFMLSKPE